MEDVLKNQSSGIVDNSPSVDFTTNSHPVTLEELKRSLALHLADFSSSDKRNAFERCFSDWMQQHLNLIPENLRKYKILFLFANRMLFRGDADSIYRCFMRPVNNGSVRKSDPILLVINSRGGYTGPSYLIGKMLHEYSSAVEIAVPRRAKSAATLLCCSANHIHMGSLSELGPIDPQMEDGPALGMKAAIEQLAKLSIDYPDARELFLGYMERLIKPISIGYYDRIVASSAQYAIRLLNIAHPNYPKGKAESIANRLAYDYKEHGFVIDKKEAQEVFGDDVVVCDSDEYRIADDFYRDLASLEEIADGYGYSFSYVGSMFDYPAFIKTK